MRDEIRINVDNFICNDDLYNLTVSSMFKKIHNRLNKAVFAFVFLMKYKQVDVANIMGVTETTISRRVKQIRKDLWQFNPQKWQFDEEKDKWKYINNCKENRQSKP